MCWLTPVFRGMDLEIALIPYETSKDCFVRLPPRVVKDIEESFLVLKATRRSGNVFFAGWTGGSAASNGVLEMPLHFAQCQDVKAKEIVHVEALPTRTAASRAIVSSSAEDWDVVLLNASLLEDIILSQIRVIFADMTLPIFVGNGSKIVLHVTELEPDIGANDCLILNAGSEIAIAPPKSRSSLTNKKTVTENRLPASFRARVLPSKTVVSSSVQMNGRMASHNGLRSKDILYLTPVDSSSGRYYDWRSIYFILEINNSVPDGHLAMHDLARAVLGSPSLSTVHAKLVDKDQAQLVSSVQLAEDYKSSDQISGRRSSSDELKTALKEWVKANGFVKEGGDVNTYLGIGTPVQLLFGDSVCDFLLCVNGESPIAASEVRPSASEVDDLTAEAHDRAWYPKTNAEASPTKNRNERTKVTVSAALKPLYMFSLADLEIGAVSIQLTSHNNNQIIPHADFGWGKGPKLKDVRGAQARREVDEILESVSPLYQYFKMSMAVREKQPAPLPITVLAGSKGSGKSFMASAVARVLREDPGVHARTVWIRCRVHSSEPVEVSCRRLDKAIMSAYRCRPSLLVLDDFDLLASAESEDPAAHQQTASRGPSIAAAFIESLQRVGDGSSGIGVLVTCSSHSALAKEITSSGHVSESLNMLPPDADMRAQLFAMFASRNWKELLSKSDGELYEVEESIFTEMAAAEGFSPLDIQRLVERISASHISSGLTRSSIAEAVQSYTPTLLIGSKAREINKAIATFSRVGGLEHAKQIMRENLEFPTKFAQVFSKAPLRVQSGCMLFGPSGCGKTYFAAASSAEFALRMISVKGPELLNKYIGSSEAAVRDAFTRASAARPCILFFDEFESVAPKRGGDTTGVSDRIVNTLLTSMDGVEALEGVRKKPCI
uniref:Peroxisomal ATPase PEX1 n=1 Tax=Rhodosorus marinus TaxID=101924 RepID=A0A7S3A8X4_9RHOD|mmetsp:Transcript_5993/g.25332  ORF Transcript_5993/g.25332 Transcript_5993/m.25332 type:complete len:894 (+) Transcript_5993:114-2795(+)